MIDWLEDEGHGRARIEYRLRDWLFSRQRYWGEPFPIVHVVGQDGEPTGDILPLPASELPVELPPVDEYRPHRRRQAATGARGRRLADGDPARRPHGGA